MAFSVNPILSPYSTVQSSMNKVTGSGGYASSPLQYSENITNLRTGSGSTTINTMGSLSPEDRIKAMADKKYEKWKADQTYRGMVRDEYSADKSSALANIPGQSFNNYMQVQGQKGGNSTTPFGQYMSDQGAAGLTGGSVSTPDQRYQGWNNQIAGQNQAYQQAMNPIWQEYGMQPQSNPIKTYW